MLQNYLFFQNVRSKISRESYRELFKEFRYESHSKGVTLFNFGDVGKKFYLILSGEVYVLVPKPKNKVLIEGTSNLIKSNKTISNREFFPFTEEEKLMALYPNMHIINVLKEGNLFGEISLNLKEPRTATVICKVDSCFGLLTAYTYERILKNNYEIELKFLKQTSLFQGFSLQNIAILKGYLCELNCGKDHIFYRHDEEADQIYIIKEGEVELIKSIAEEDLKLIKSKDFLKIEKNKKKRFSIGILGYGETFGEEEIFLQKPRLYTAVVRSLHARVFVLTRENLLQNLKSIKSLNSLEDHFIMKFKWRNNQLKKISNLMNTLKKNNNTVSNRAINLNNYIKQPNEENKKIFLQSLNLKHIRNKYDGDNAVGNNSNAYSLYFSKKPTNRDLKINTDRGYIGRDRESYKHEYRDGLHNYEVSPILKMCAVSTALSKFAKRKRKFSMPNVRLMAQNFENEVIKSIENTAGKMNNRLLKRPKAKPEYLHSNKQILTNKKHEWDILMQSLRIDDKSERKYYIDKGFKGESIGKNNGSKWKFFSQERSANETEEKSSYYGFPMMKNEY